MFKVTKAAAAEIKRNLSLSDEDDIPIRVAAQRDADGSIHYQMGFDEAGPGDTMVASAGIDVVIANEHKPLLSGCEMDFVSLEDETKSFIFLNPNDPTYVEPDRSENSDGDGSGKDSGRNEHQL